MIAYLMTRCLCFRKMEIPQKVPTISVPLIQDSLTSGLLDVFSKPVQPFTLYREFVFHSEKDDEARGHILFYKEK